MTFWSALLLGLVASTHCIGMCGGLQLALQSSGNQAQVVRSQNQQLLHLLLMNLGRIITYSLAGFLLSFLGATTILKLNINTLASAARLFTGIIIVLIGTQILLKHQRPFQFIESLGASLWKRVSRLINHSSSSVSSSLINGVAWGFLPCGLVYGVLLSTILLQDPLNGAVVMSGFGLGTIPALVLTGSVYQRFKSTIKSEVVQRASAVFFILGGLLVISGPYWVTKEFIRDYPILLNMVFCIT